MSITRRNTHGNVSVMETNSNYRCLKYSVPTKYLPILESKSKFYTIN